LQLGDIDRLDAGRLPASIAPILETVRLVRAGLPAAAALIGFAGGPFTVACYMVDGRGGGEFPRTRLLAHGEPLAFDRLIGRLTEATITYLAAQIEAGAETVMLFESWGGILPPSLFRRHVIAPTRRIAVALRQRFPAVKLIGFPRLAGALLGEYAAASEVDAVGMDTATDPAAAVRMVPTHVALQGNLDPMALLAGGEALGRETDGILAALRGRAHVFNLGHGIVPETPPEHVTSLLARIRDA